MKTVITLFVACLLSACGAESPDSRNDQFAVNNSVTDVQEKTDPNIADTFFTNGIIWTGEGNSQDATVMVVKDGLITYVGDGKTIRVAAKEVVDLKGQFVMPGFIDNHVHFFDGAAGLASVDLRNATSPEKFSKRIIDYAKTIAPGSWILIGNWDHEMWGGELPRKEWIDAGTKNNPVFVMRLDGHMALANSAALTLAGINTETRSPEGGEIIRNSNGQPTGLLKDNAMNLIFEVIPDPTDDQLVEMFTRAQTLALSLGLTEVNVVIGYPHETSQFDQLRMIQDRGVMKIRINSFTPITDWENAKSYASLKGNKQDKLRWMGFKGFVDGSLGSTTAWFDEAYIDAPDTSGMPLNDTEKLYQIMHDIDESGLKMTIHAIGDKAIDYTIKSMREIAGDKLATRRFRIEHFQHPSSAAINNAAESGIIASMQPYHAIDDGRWAEERIGPERIKTTYAFRTILDAGVTMTFGSDWPVAPLSPLEGVYAAVTRRTIDGANPDGWQPQEKITVEQALKSYTFNNAYANFDEDIAGTLQAGKRADFIILSDDPRAVKPEAIKNIKVNATFIDGNTVFQIK